jgi:hypothetical protein
MEVELERETYPMYARRHSTICLLVVSAYFYPTLCQVGMVVASNWTVLTDDGGGRVTCSAV